MICFYKDFLMISCEGFSITALPLFMTILAISLPINLKSVDMVVMPPATTSFSSASLNETRPTFLPRCNLNFFCLFNNLNQVPVVGHKVHFTLFYGSAIQRIQHFIIKTILLAKACETCHPLFRFLTTG